MGSSLFAQRFTTHIISSKGKFRNKVVIHSLPYDIIICDEQITSTICHRHQLDLFVYVFNFALALLQYYTHNNSTYDHIPFLYEWP